MNATTLNFITELKSVPLTDYTLENLQIAIGECYHLYLRFHKEEERTALIQVWKKMTEQYNTKLKERYPRARDVYNTEYLTKLKK